MDIGVSWRLARRSLIVSLLLCCGPAGRASAETSADGAGEPAAVAAVEEPAAADDELEAAAPAAESDTVAAAGDLPADASPPGPNADAISADPSESLAVQPPAASRIRLKIDVSGEIFAPAGRNAPPVRRPIGVAARFDFVELPSGEAGGGVVRQFRDATAEVTVADDVHRTALAGDARTVNVSLQGTTPAPHLAAGFLSRDELDLLETPFDALLIDRLLPSAPVAVDERWTVAADATAGLLAIDTVESGELEARVVETADGQATLKLAGIVDGAVDGVPTHLVVEGTCTVPMAAAAGPAAVQLQGPIGGVDVTLRERREASHVAPGFDVEARIVMARSPDRTPATAVSPPAEPAAPRRQGPGRPGFVWHREPRGRYDLVHDARWRVIEDGPEGLVMRLVDRGALAGQCSVTALPRAAANAPPTIAEVERDVERSLDGQFGRFESSAQSTRDDGTGIVRVVAVGRADGLPFRWMHYVLTDADGRRLTATFMVEEALVKRFGAADRELVDALRISAPEPSRPAGVPAPREARLPSESATP